MTEKYLKPSPSSPLSSSEPEPTTGHMVPLHLLHVDVQLIGRCHPARLIFLKSEVGGCTSGQPNHRNLQNGHVYNLIGNK